jgi:hypothetical protein
VSLPRKLSSFESKSPLSGIGMFDVLVWRYSPWRRPAQRSEYGEGFAEYVYRAQGQRDAEPNFSA